MDVIEEEQRLARADAVGARVRGRLEAFATRNDLLAIGNIRGLGAMLGFDILDRDTGQPNGAAARAVCARALEQGRSEEHTSELQSLMRNSYAVFCLNKKKKLSNKLQQTR